MPHYAWMRSGLSRSLAVPDVAVLQHGGAKWGHAHVWQHDPKTSAFITTPLTREFAKLTFASYRVDAKARRLYLRKFHGAQIFEHICRITPERLEFESEKLWSVALQIPKTFTLPVFKFN